MNLKQLKEHIESFPDGYMFEYSLSQPFSWRGSYDEVAFSVFKIHSTKEQMLSCIEKALTEVFTGYKGGEYEFHSYTPVNFEYEFGAYTDGGYCAALIAEIENANAYVSNEHRLVSLAFS